MNDGNISEAADRTNTLCIMLEELLLNHPGVRATNSGKEYEDAMRHLVILYDKLCNACDDYGAKH